jgi:HAMP domain-containing protein
MSDETAIGSAGTPDRAGHSGGSSGEQSPLQARAAFIKNWDWQFVTSLNRGACARGGAQHGFNSETQEACRREWEEKQRQILSLDDTIEFLRHCHRRAPFLFFNGNTFADIARQIVAALFAELPSGRRREVMSAVAHHIAGVLDHEPMAQIVNELCGTADFKPGDRVKTLRGSMRGMILRVLPDGRVLWRADSGAELTALPESLVRDQKK